MPLFLILIVVPLIELMLLIQVGGMIGTGWTFVLIIATAFIGAKLVRQQGLQTWSNIQQEMAQGQLPAQSLFDGICILISGVMLITPGLITDVIGLLLMIPAFRAISYRQFGNKIKFKAAASAHFQQSQSQGHSTFEGEFTETTETDNDHRISEHKPTTLDGDFERKD